VANAGKHFCESFFVRLAPVRRNLVTIAVALKWYNCTPFLSHVRNAMTQNRKKEKNVFQGSRDTSGQQQTDLVLQGRVISNILDELSTKELVFRSVSLFSIL